jgi:cell division protein FtsW (lipid II flippase)
MAQKKQNISNTINTGIILFIGLVLNIYNITSYISTYSSSIKGIPFDNYLFIQICLAIIMFSLFAILVWLFYKKKDINPLYKYLAIVVSIIAFIGPAFLGVLVFR